jgi:iron complex outermembrane recepter protein
MGHVSHPTRTAGIAAGCFDRKHHVDVYAPLAAVLAQAGGRCVTGRSTRYSNSGSDQETDMESLESGFGRRVATRVAALLLCACAALGSGLASAQDPPADSGGIEEVVVTAQRRAENVQDVSMAITAFSAESLEALGWKDITQVATQTPNVDIKYVWGNSMPVATIRGIGMNDFQANSKPGVGFYVDEVYLPSIALMGLQLFDMERLEVLKGPQGTLYGRNTNGGAINYITRKPTQEADGYVRGSFGNFQRAEYEGAFGGPITDTVSGRISFYGVNQGEGQVFNRVSGNDHGEVDIWAARGQLRFQPNESLDVIVNVHGGKDTSEGAYFQHVGFWNRGANGMTAAPQRFCAAVLQGRRDPANCVDQLQYSDRDNDVYAGDYTARNDLSFNGTPLNFDDWTLDNTNIGGGVHVDYTFANGLTLTSVSAYESYDRFQPKESDAQPLLFLDLYFASKIRSYAQELRIASDGEGDLSWIAGVNYTNESIDEDPPRVLFVDAFLVNRAQVSYYQDQNQLAGFGHVDWKFADDWKLSVGARYLKENIDFQSESSFLIPPAFGQTNRVILAAVPGVINVPGQAPVPVPGLTSDTALTGRVALDWKVRDNLMLYGSFARGYKGGGFNGGFVTNIAQWIPYEPEEVNAYELGFKSDWFDRRLILNGALFYSDYKNLQAVSSRPSATGVVQNFLANLTKAEISGAELELTARPIRNFEIRAGLGLLDAKNKDPQPLFDGPFAAAGVFAPRQLANSPDYTVNLAMLYDLPLADGAALRFATDINHAGRQYKEIQNNVAMEVPEQGLWNGSISWRGADDRWNVSLWGRNLANEEFIVDTLSTAAANGWGVLVYGMPRTYGISAEYRWK